MKILIVNADDFGYSFGVNKGIIEAHTKGIVTSTSVMADGLAAKEARKLLKFPKLSIGLHFIISEEKIKAGKIKNEFNRQIDKFIKIVGKPPDHLDAHKHAHMNPKVKPIFEEYSHKNKTPVRAFGDVNFIDSYFGWDKQGKKDLSRVSVKALLKILSNLKEGINELMCHPGYVDDDLRKISSYLEKREKDLETLKDKRVMNYIKRSEIKLFSWKEEIVRNQVL